MAMKAAGGISAMHKAIAILLVCDGVVAAIVSGGLWLSSAALLRRYEHRIGTRRTALRGGRRISDQQQAART